MMKDIKLTKEELNYMKRNNCNHGSESYIYKVDDKTASKIFKISSFNESSKNRYLIDYLR